MKLILKNPTVKVWTGPGEGSLKGFFKFGDQLPARFVSMEWYLVKHRDKFTLPYGGKLPVS
jgi:hypothetical protein